MDTNKHVIDLLPDFLAGTFDESDRNAIQSHLQSCSSCRQEFESLSTLWNTLGVLPDAKPGPQVRQRFNAMLAAYEQGIRHASSRASMLSRLDAFIGRLWPQRPAFQFGIAVLMLMLGGIVGSRIDRTTEPASTTQTSYRRTRLQCRHERSCRDESQGRSP